MRKLRNVIALALVIFSLCACSLNSYSVSLRYNVDEYMVEISTKDETISLNDNGDGTFLIGTSGSTIKCQFMDNDSFDYYNRLAEMNTYEDYSTETATIYLFSYTDIETIRTCIIEKINDTDINLLLVGNREDLLVALEYVSIEDVTSNE